MRTLVVLLILFLNTSIFAQINFTIEQQEDGVTYVVKLKPEKSFPSPMNITNTAQISLVVPTGGFQPGNIQNFKGNWQNNNNIVSPDTNPKKDYLIFNLVGHIKDLDYVEGEEVPIFSFQNTGKDTGMPRFVGKNDTNLFKSKKLNIGNQISVLGAGFVNAYSGSYAEEEEGPEEEDTHILYGNEIFGTFDLDINVKKEGIMLEWLVENKGNTKQYTIEKSMDGVNFEAIQVITDNTEDWLAKLDETPDYGTNYYRVKQQYRDGNYRYSSVQSQAFLIDEAAITIYPNPVKDMFNLKVGHFSNLEGQVRIFNLSGAEMAHKPLNKGNNKVSINTSDFQNGMYFLIIEGDGKKVVERQFVVENNN